MTGATTSTSVMAHSAAAITAEDLVEVLVWDNDDTTVFVEHTGPVANQAAARAAAAAWWEHCTNDTVDVARIRDLGYLELCQDPYDDEALRRTRPDELPDYRVWAFDLAAALGR